MSTRATMRYWHLGTWLSCHLYLETRDYSVKVQLCIWRFVPYDGPAPTWLRLWGKR